VVQRCVHLVTPKLQAQSTVKLETTVRVLKTVEKLCVLCVFSVCSLCVLCVFSVGDLSVIWVDLSVLCGRLWESWCHQLERKGCTRVDAQSAFFKSLFCIDFCFVFSNHCFVLIFVLFQNSYTTVTCGSNSECWCLEGRCRLRKKSHSLRR
jgi:hypothetical protein